MIYNDSDKHLVSVNLTFVQSPVQTGRLRPDDCVPRGSWVVVCHLGDRLLRPLTTARS